MACRGRALSWPGVGGRGFSRERGEGGGGGGAGGFCLGTVGEDPVRAARGRSGREGRWRGGRSGDTARRLQLSLSPGGRGARASSMDLPDEFFSRIGVLLSLTTETFLSLVPLQMSDSKAPLPFASSRLSLGGVVLAWLKVGGGGGGPGAGGAGGGAGILTFNTASQSQHTFTRLPPRHTITNHSMQNKSYVLRVYKGRLE